MGLELLGSIMKIFNYLYSRFEKLSFIQGVVLSICLSSIVSIAATNIPGFFVFNAGTPISSSEVNTNFEKLSGNIILKANVSGTESITNTGANLTKKMNFDSISIGSANFKTTTDTDPASASYGSIFSYYEVASDGWYEIRLIPTYSTDVNNIIQNIVCPASCNFAVYVGYNINVASGVVVQGSAYNRTLISTVFSAFKKDTNSDGVVDVSTTSPMVIGANSFYLTTGQVVFIAFTANSQALTGSADFMMGYNAGSQDLTIIKR